MIILPKVDIMCDMCSSPDVSYKIEVEGTLLNVCEKCSSFGRIVGKIKKPEPVQKKKPQLKIQEEAKPKKETETVQMIVANYSTLIKSAREKLGLKQEEVAKKIAEKESTIHKLESRIIKPNLELARKLERFLKIKVIEEVEIESPVNDDKRKGSDALTLGDLIKI